MINYRIIKLSKCIYTISDPLWYRVEFRQYTPEYVGLGIFSTFSEAKKCILKFQQVKTKNDQNSVPDIVYEVSYD